MAADSPTPRRRWYLRPGGIPLPETDRKAADGARYTCLEGDDHWEELPTWRPPEECEVSRTTRRATRDALGDRGFFSEEEELFRERID
jgi:hypothetical protein